MGSDLLKLRPPPAAPIKKFSIFTMQFIDRTKHTGGILTAVVSAFGAAIFLFWQPINDYFITKVYDDNIVLQLDTDSLTSADDQSLLTIRVRVANRGTVPVQLNSHSNDELNLEIRHVDKFQQGQWVDTDLQPVVAKKIVLKMDKSIVSVSPNSYWAKEIAVPLKVGTYVLRANLNKQGGSLVSEEIFVQLKK